MTRRLDGGRRARTPLRPGAVWVFGAGLVAGILISLGITSWRGREPQVAAPPTEAASPVGAVVAGAEFVEVLTPNGGAARRVHSKRLTPGSTVWLARTGTAEVALRDGGRVKLTANAIVRFREAGLVLYRGRVELQVKRGAEPFAIELPGAFVVADEAEFVVSLDETTRRAKVEMVDGCVWLGNQRGSVALADGEEAEVHFDSMPAVSG